jgi:hypothetical protein
MEVLINGLEIKTSFSEYDIENSDVRNKYLSNKKYVRFYGTAFNLSLVPPIMSQNVLFTGGIGSGKTNAIFQITDQLLQSIGQNDVLIIFDSKGDFRGTFGASLPSARMKFLSNNSGSNVTWNMFREAVSGLKPSASRREVDDALLELSSILFQPLIDRDKNNPFFTLAAKNIFYGILKVLSEKHYIGTRNPAAVTNKMIYDFAQQNAEAIYNEFTSPACQADTGQLTDYIGRVDSAGRFRFNDQGAAVLATMKNILIDIFKGNFVKTGDFSIREFVRAKSGNVLFVEYDINQGHLLAPVYKALMDFAIKEALGRERTAGNVVFIIDEFRLLPKLDYIDAGVNFGRSLGLKFFVGIQNILQIDTIYEKAAARSILSGFLTTVNFRTTDSETRDYIKSLFGKKIYSYENESMTGGRTRDKDDVIADHDILKLETGQAIIGIPVLSKNPILFSFKQFEEYLKGR